MADQKTRAQAPSPGAREQAMSVERIKGWLERNPQGGPEPIHPDDLRALLAARAEAQDEGAAGEREKWIEDARDFAERMISQPAACEIIERLLMIIQAHPSPTPAADADRVRAALTDLVTWFDKPVQGERGMVWVIRAGDQGADDAVAEALAALKSEGK